MLRARPLTLRDANEVVTIFHRHHKPTQGHKFSIGCEQDGVLVGAVIVGRPVARNTDHTRVAEVTRLVTTGEKNVCSFLYSAAARAATAMGYDRIQTFILEDEPGTSLKAAGWLFDGMTSGGAWDRASRPVRRHDQPEGRKQRWVRDLRH